MLGYAFWTKKYQNINLTTVLVLLKPSNGSDDLTNRHYASHKK